MTRRRYVQSKEPPYELIEITEDYQAPLRNDAGVLWGDRNYDGAQTTDGVDISTRTKHRAYMKATGLTLADDYKESWAKAQEQRERYHQQGGSFDRSAIERAIHHLQNRR